MKIYMDACCLNRSFDDQGQDRVRLEAEAILNILEYCQSGEPEQICNTMSNAWPAYFAAIS